MIAIKNMGIPTDCYSCFLSASDCPISMFRHDRRADNCSLVEIITCKDCKHWNFNENRSILHGYCNYLETETNEDFYCGGGERRE